MKKRSRYIGVKIICFIFCILFFIITAASIFGVSVLSSEGVYTMSEDEHYRGEMWYQAYSDAQLLRWLTLEQKGDYKETVYKDYYDPSISNLRYEIYIPQDGVYLRYSNFEGTITDWDYSYKCNMSNYHLFEAEGPGDFERGYLTINVYIDRNFPVNDVYARYYRLVDFAHYMKYWIFVIMAVSFLICISLFIVLINIAGKVPDSEEVKGGVFNRVPFDIILGIALLVFAIGSYILGEHSLLRLSNIGSFEWEEAVVILGLSTALACTFLLLSMSIASRIKQKKLFANTVIRKVLNICGRGIRFVSKKALEIFRMIPIAWKALIIIAGISFIDFAAFVYVYWEMTFRFLAVYIVLKTVVLCICAIYIAMFMKKLQKGAEALAKGDLEFKTDTKDMFWDFKKHGENLNAIGYGMEKAVEERLKSERTKGELITNVSHDIKTPLTSIINYATLISEEECENGKHGEYSEVLVRKSEHLKRLLEDIVEISKATTGNLDVDLQPCEAGVLLTQAAGEFQEKCDSAGLVLVTNIPEESIKILADGRRIWRVFENLMNNACKYSLHGSRVYLSLLKEGNDVLFVFRNTSREALNISPDELMERFVRGDESRTTEGNGLGLSIARSLVELQNGKMDISIDGDLFKVVLRFPSV